MSDDVNHAITIKDSVRYTGQSLHSVFLKSKPLNSILCESNKTAIRLTTYNTSLTNFNLCRFFSLFSAYSILAYRQINVCFL